MLSQNAKHDYTAYKEHFQKELCSFNGEAGHHDKQ